MTNPAPTSPTQAEIEAMALLPCPFCGGDATYDHSESGRWSVGCDDINGDCMGFQTLQTFPRKVDATVAWNTRAQPAPEASADRFDDSLGVHVQANADRMAARMGCVFVPHERSDALPTKDRGIVEPEASAGGVMGADDLEDHGDGALEVHQWINRAYGTLPRDISARFTRFNMVVAYRAGQASAATPNTLAPEASAGGVIQADREAAIDLVSPREARDIAAGACDDHMLVQAFKRHRLTTTLNTLTARDRAVPDGWKLVPVEPTEAMVKALWRETLGGTMLSAERAARAMLAAAPDPHPQPKEAE